MRTRFLIALALLAAVGADRPRTATPKKTATPKPDAPPSPLPLQGFRAVAASKPRVSPPLEEMIVGQLNAAKPLPPARAAHFNWMAGKYRVLGYHATVHEAEATPDGWHARIFVMPVVDSSLHGSVTITDAAIEEYRMSHGTLSFVGSVRPPGFGPGEIID